MPPDPVTSGTDNGNAASRPDNQQSGASNPKRGKRTARLRVATFEGRTEAIKQHVYDVGPKSKEVFARTTKEIAEYIARNYKGGGEFLIAMDPNSLGFPPVDPPQDPADNSPLALERWKLKLRRYDEQYHLRNEVSKQVYAVILGQCSDAVRDRLNADNLFTTIAATCDVIGLLQLIQASLYAGATTKKTCESSQEALERLMALHQGSRMSNSKYLEVFKDHVEIVEYFGVTLGQESHRVKGFLDEITGGNSPTGDQLKEAKSKAKDEYYAVLFLRKACARRYGGLMADIQNAKTCGHDQYPDNLPKAYEYLVNYVRAPRTSSDHIDSGVSFYTDSNSAGRGGPSGARSGRQNRTNGGRGRGGQSKRKDNEDDTLEEAHAVEAEPETGNVTNDANADTPVADNANKGGVDQYSAVSPSQQSVVSSYLLSESSDKWLLLDSCSTANIISNPKFLHDVHHARHEIKVHTLAGTVNLNKKGYLGDYPDAVWYHEGGSANIMSLSQVAQHYRVTMDSSIDSGLHIHQKNGNTIHFSPHRNNLYALSETSTNTPTSIWTTASPRNTTHAIETVKKNASGYPRRLYERAMRARKFQNIIMRPGSRQLSDVAIKHLSNCPITVSDIKAADHIFGRNLGSLKGKTPRELPQHVLDNIDPVPAEILRNHRNITLCIDIMHIDKIPFLITRSRNIGFGTVTPLNNRQTSNIAAKLKSVIRIYSHRGFNISLILGDHEFEPLRPYFPQLNTAAAGEHVPDIERYIRTVKDRTRSTYTMLPFRHVPRLMLCHLARNSVLWLNALPHNDGVSNEHSPCYILTGRELTYDKHVKLQFGDYVQTAEEHDNSMNPRTMGAICLGPTGNSQGGHWFMSLTSGSRVIRYQWTSLPMPTDVINRVSQMGRDQHMPATISYSNRSGDEILNTIEDYDNEDDLDDSTHHTEPEESDDELSYDDSTSDSSTDETSSESDEDDDDDDYDPDGSSVSNNEDDDTSINDENSIRIDIAPTQNDRNTDAHLEDGNEPSLNDIESDNTYEFYDGTDNESDWTSSDSNIEDTSQDIEQTGVDESTGQTGVDQSLEQTGVDANRATSSTTSTYEQFQQQEEIGRQSAITGTALPKRERRPTRQDDSYLYSALTDSGTSHLLATDAVSFATIAKTQAIVPDQCFLASIAPHAKELINFLTAQMSAKQGLKMFGEQGAEALMKELEQLLYMDVVEPVHAEILTREQKIAALKYLMFLKEKRSGKIKGRGCADGRKQRLYKTKEETYAPTVSTEGVFLTAIIDAMECREVAIVDIPGAFMQSDIDEEIHVKLEGDLVDLLIRIDSTYTSYVTRERGKRVIYTRLKKALYGTMQAALLFWENLSSFLINKLGFTVNPYDSCVVNKDIERTQCTIIWHVDDLKISHRSKAVVDNVIKQLSAKFGKKAPLSVHRGKTFDDYLGMKVDFSQHGKVVITMRDYIDRIISETPDWVMKGPCSTPAANHLFHINDGASPLSKADSELYHHLTAMLLYLAKRARPDIQTAISFLTTRVQSPTNDDMKKLGRCIRYLSTTRELPVTLECDRSGIIRWWIDASYAVHPNMRSHTGATMSLGSGSPYSISSKQKINTRSSTEAELVGVNDALALVLWTRNFLIGQGFTVKDNVIYQDNQSAILLENNGTRSSSKKTRHIEIRYYFITDQIRRKNARVDYCPTDIMLADFFTKPLQGSSFQKFRSRILNLPDHHQDSALSGSPLQECVGTTGSRTLNNNDKNDEMRTASSSLTSAQSSGSESKLRRQTYASVAARASLNQMKRITKVLRLPC